MVVGGAATTIWDGLSFRRLSSRRWKSLGGLFSNSLAAVSREVGRLDLFSVGSDNAAYDKAWSDNAWLPSQINWEGFGGVFNGELVVAPWGSDRLDISGVGTNNGVYYKA
jgi:hypothetical protein